MKCTFNLMLVLLVISSLALSACMAASSPGSLKCSDELCVDVKLAEPIRFDEPVTATITVQPKRDIPGLGIYLSASSPRVVFGPEQKWTVDAKANQTIVRTGTARFQGEGDFDVYADAHNPQRGAHTTGYVRVRVTRVGGTVNPPPEVAPGVPVLVPQATSLSPLPTSAPTAPLGKPTSWNRLLPRLQPDELAARCGWPPSSVAFTPWSGAKVWVEVPEQVPLDKPVPIVIGLEVPKTQTQPVQIKLAFCPTDPSVQAEGKREWQIEVRAGVPVTVTATIRFTQAGEFGVLGGAYDPATGRVVGAGQRTRVGAGAAQPQSPNVNGWVKITEENFESIWPPSPGLWSVRDLSNDGYERYWDDSSYRPHNDYWAAWPAYGGRDWVDPAQGDHDYPNNMDTRMIYGPFDLSDATMADADFYLWREMETDYDYLAFEVSHDGVAFQELARWTGSAGWEFKDVYFNDYVGDDSVWVAWRFYSDYSVTYDGPWVDDICLWKFMPGQVTARGSFHYYDRNNNWVPARFTRVYLYDEDPGGSDDLLTQTTTDANGFFQFLPVCDWDVDDSSPSPYDRRLDLYVVWETSADDSPTSRRRVTNFGDWAYKWRSATRTDVSDEMVEFHNYIPANGVYEAAMWIFQDLRRGWEYVHNNTGADPGSATAHWEKDKDSLPLCQDACFWPFPPVNGIFIPHFRRSSSDVVMHELGHQYLYNANGLDIDLSCLAPHQMFEKKGQVCAWVEGWSDFFALAVNGDPCYDWGIGPCGGGSENLETPTWPVFPDQRPTGDDVEGRVAGALYDLFDRADDGYDRANFGIFSKSRGNVNLAKVI